jgi:hypothetical protein
MVEDMVAGDGGSQITTVLTANDFMNCFQEKMAFNNFLL